MSETRHPEHSDADHQWASLEPAEPPKRIRRKVDWPFLLLGFFTPAALYGLVGFTSLPDTLANLAPWLFVAHFVGSLIALILGRQNKIERLRSYGLGGVVFYGVVLLALLLLFGSCLLFYKP